LKSESFSRAELKMNRFSMARIFRRFEIIFSGLLKNESFSGASLNLNRFSGGPFGGRGARESGGTRAGLQDS
jgi:hypothetical protein